MSLDHKLRRRTVFKGAGGLAAASIIGAGAAWNSTTPAHAEGLEIVSHETDGRMQTYEFVTPSVKKPENPSYLARKYNPTAKRNPRVNVLLPDGYDSGKRYPVLYQFHGGGGQYTEFDGYNIREMTAGRDLIVVMPDAGLGWHCNPVSSNVGPRNWETFHIEELIPWVDATFRTFPEQAGRAVSGFSMGGFGALKYTAKYSDKFASVSAHSGPANLRTTSTGIRLSGQPLTDVIVRWANFTSAAFELLGGTIYGAPESKWRQDLITADNPIENLESYRNKRIFLVAGTDRLKPVWEGHAKVSGLQELFSVLNEDTVLNTQREFAEKLDSAEIKYERYEEQGGHFVRLERLQQDIDGIVAHLRKAE